jgi:hypothetical protein
MRTFGNLYQVVYITQGSYCILQTRLHQFLNDHNCEENGLYDVIVDHWDGKGSDNKDQMWFWDDKDHSLHNYGH